MAREERAGQREVAASGCRGGGDNIEWNNDIRSLMTWSIRPIPPMARRFLRRFRKD